MTVLTHVSAVFSYSEGYFALKARKNIFCLGRQKMFFYGGDVGTRTQDLSDVNRTL